MPLSEHEQRQLEQIERALYADDPKLASTVRASDLRSHLRRRLWRGLALIGVGLVALLAGVALALWPVGVGGFLVMLVGALFIASISKHSSLIRGTRHGPRRHGPRRQTRSRPSKAALMERLEERWRRRREEGGH